MFRRGASRVLTLILVAVAVERLTRQLPATARFALVFASAFMADNLKRLSSASDRPLFLEDAVLGLISYTGLGYLSSLLDRMLSAYTGRQGSPIVPAVILALLDKAWPSRSLSSKRR